MAARPRSATGGEQTADAADMARQIAELRVEITRLTEGLATLSEGKASGLLDQLQARMAAIAGSAEAGVKDKIAGADATLEAVTDYARQKPLHALAVAAGAGMVFGLIFGRR